MIVIFFNLTCELFFNDIQFYKLNEYDLIVVKDCGFFSNPGEPLIPIKILSLEIDNKFIDIKELDEEWIEISGYFKLFPGQKGFPLQLNSFDFLQPDSLIYNSSKFFPEKTIIYTGQGLKRGKNIVNFAIFPIKYIPKEGKIYFLKFIRFKINVDKKSSYYPDFHLFRKNEDKTEEIIITKNDFIKFFEPLKDWKTQKGVKTEIFDVDSIILNFSGNTKQEKIRNFIKWAYTSLGTDYVLLGGQCDYENNHEVIPRMDLFYKSSGISGEPYDKDTIPSDMYYSNLDGDWNFDGDNTYGEIEDSVDLYSDIYVGRAPCKDTNEVKIFVNKVINYERNPATDYIKKVMLPAEFLYYSYWGDTVNNIISNITPDFVKDIKLYQSTGNYSGSMVKNTIEEGVNFSHFASHGNAYGTAGITIQDIDELTNNSKIGLFTGISCMTGAVDYVQGGDCFAEHIVLNPNGGGVASIMNTRYGWGYIPGLGPSETIDTTMFHLIYVDSILNLGKINSLSKEQYVPVVQLEGINGYYRWCIYELMLFGDPEMPVWTRIPDSIFTYFKKVISIEDSLFIVSVKDRFRNPLIGARVCIMKGKEIYKVGRTDDSGYAILKLNQHSSGFMNITVTKDNFIPFIDSIYITEKMKIIISPDSIPINEFSNITIQVGDEYGNAIPDIEFTIKGEEISLKDTTDNFGIAYFSLFPVYGESLYITGRRLKENHIIFEGRIFVYGGEEFQKHEITCGSDLINISGSLMKNIECYIKTYTKPEGHKTFIKGCGIDTFTQSYTDTLNVLFIPLKDGVIDARICKEGYNVLDYFFAVKDFKGYVSGKVIDLYSGNPVDPSIWIYNCDTFRIKTAGGYFTLDSLVCGYYNLKAEAFGFYIIDTTVIVRHPYNFYELFLKPMPKSIVSGFIVDKITGKGITAQIDVYAKDSLIISLNSDLSGFFSFKIPYFDYIFYIRSKGYKSIDTLIKVECETLKIDFKLYRSVGKILILNDDSTGNSPIVLHNLLSKIGYYSDVIPFDSAYNFIWEKYDILILSSGRNRNPLNNKDIRKKIKDWYEKFGKIIIEGGDVGYFYSWDDFGKKVLHIKDWKGNDGGNLILKKRTHPIVNYPNLLPETLKIKYEGWADQDICEILKDVELIYGTEKIPDCSGIFVYDNTPSLESGQLVYFGFNFEKLCEDVQIKLLENTIKYLYSKEPEENAELRIFTDPKGSLDNSVLVKVFWEGKLYKIDTTDTLGEGKIKLYNGTYDIMFSKDNYSDTLIRGVNIFNRDMYLKVNLYPFIKLYSCDFETDSGNLIHSGDWEWGEVSYGPEYGSSGFKVWGTVLDSNYSKNSDSRLETPSIYLPNDKNIIFSFNMWLQTDSFYDGGNVKISRNNSGFGIIDPVYPVYNIEKMSTQNRGIPKERGWTGNMTEWKKVEFNLSQFAGDTIKIRWHFGSNYIREYPGWFIDDVIIGYTDYNAGDDEEKIIFKSQTIFKNEIIISIYSNISTRYGIYIYDILGRLVLKTEGFIFPGTNECKVSVGKQGIYFIKTVVNKKTNQIKAILIK